MRKAMVGPALAIVVLMSIGGATLGGLALGDAQWQRLTNKGVCDDEHYITTFIPKFVKETGDVERLEFKVKCSNWFPKR